MTRRYRSILPSIIDRRVHSWSVSHAADGLFGRVLGSLMLTWSLLALIGMGMLCANQSTRIGQSVIEGPTRVTCETLNDYRQAKLVRCVSTPRSGERISEI